MSRNNITYTNVYIKISLLKIQEIQEVYKFPIYIFRKIEAREVRSFNVCNLSVFCVNIIPTYCFVNEFQLL